MAKECLKCKTSGLQQHYVECPTCGGIDFKAVLYKREVRPTDKISLADTYKGRK
jgi:Zn finger protein HypA/HybF involved in hydrogenase expression